MHNTLINSGWTTATKLHVVFTEDAYAALTALVKNCDKEIAWHMHTEREMTAQGIFIKIDNIIVPPQMVTGATVNTDASKYAQFCIDNDLTGWCGHGHSHVNMGVFSSSTDDDYQKDQVNSMTEGFYLFTIHNKRGEMFLRYYDIDNKVMIDDSFIEWQVQKEQDFDGWAKEQIKSQVTTQVIVHSTSKTKTTGKYNPYHVDDDDDGMSYFQDFWRYYSPDSWAKQMEDDSIGITDSIIQDMEHSKEKR